KLAELWGAQQDWVPDLGKHPHEANYLTLDTALARKELGWQPVLSTDNALKLIVNWEQNRLKGADVFKTTQQQINNYQSMVAH
ncbi:MAG: CDP-glucose 4,6-dehydratase, partial [Limnohabitans sp.]